MTTQPNKHDDVIEEIHEARARIAEKFGGDIAAIVEDARRRQAVAGRPVWQGRREEQGQTADEVSRNP